MQIGFSVQINCDDNDDSPGRTIELSLMEADVRTVCKYYFIQTMQYE